MDVTSSAIAILATSPDFKTTIQNLADLGSSELADWCAIFSFENEQTVRRLTAPEGLYGLDLHASSGPGRVLRTGEHEISTIVTDEMVENLGLKPTQIFPANGSKPTCYLCIPLRARDRNI